jgi:hypothetical protein
MMNKKRLITLEAQRDVGWGKALIKYSVCIILIPSIHNACITERSEKPEKRQRAGLAFAVLQEPTSLFSADHRPAKS